MIDYCAILQKYIAHVISCEGVDFIGDRHRKNSDVTFTDEEWRELELATDEAERKKFFREEL